MYLYIPLLIALGIFILLYSQQLRRIKSIRKSYNDNIRPTKSYNETIYAIDQTFQAVNNFYKIQTDSIWTIGFDKSISIKNDKETIAEQIYERAFYLDCNDKFAKLFGFSSRDKIVGKHIKEIELFNKEGLLSEFIEFIESNYTLENTTYGFHESSDNVMYYANSFQGNIVDEHLVYVFGIVKDITKFKLAEQEFVDLKQAVDKTKEGIVITDDDSKPLYINKAFMEITGYTFEDVKDNALNQMMFDDMSCFPESEKEMLKLKDKGGSWLGKTIIRTKSGVHKTIMVNLTEVEYTTHPYKRFIAVFTDISREKKMEDALLHSQKMQALGTLTGGVAHDFNNVLAVILGNTDYLISNFDTTDKDEILDSLHIINRSAKQAEAQTHRLLAFGRKSESRIESLLLDNWLSEGKLILSQVVKQDIKLEFNLDAENAIVGIDKNLFELVLLNLVKNAVDAIDGKGEIKICSKLVNYKDIDIIEKNKLSNQDYAVIEINDTGKGIPANLQNRIFEPFFTTKEVNKGTGLGLSMVYGIVEEHNGVISVESIEDKGSTFSIYIPVTESDRDTLNIEEVIDDLQLKQVSINFIDNDKNFRNIMKKHFKAINLKCNFADSVEGDLHSFIDESAKFNVIIVSNDISNLRDYKFIDELRLLKPDLKCIIIGSFTESVIKDQQSWNCDATLCKPFTFNSLLNNIHELLMCDCK